MAPESDAPAHAPATQRQRWFGPYRGLPLLLSLKWLAAGAGTYALLLLVAIAGNPDDVLIPVLGPSVYLTPVFGLPLLLATPHRPGRMRRLVYFLLLLPLAHMAANYLAWSHGVASFDPFDRAGQFARNLASGALGGLAGAALSFAALYLIGLTGRRRVEPLPMLLASFALAALGALGMALGAQWSGAMEDTRALHGAGRLIIWFETLHLPWQLGFSLALAWLMRPLRDRRRRSGESRASLQPEAG